MNSKKLFSGVVVALGALVLASAPVFAQATDNIVEIAQDTPDLSTLVTAVTEADLVDTLSDSSANYTVFAPTNAAFDALPAGTLDSLLEDANQDDLVDVLTYHVVDSEAFAADLNDGDTLTTLQGETLEVEITGSDVFINGNQVTTADVDANNGVVHIIDGVLLPAGIAEAHSTADTGGEEQVEATNLAPIFALVATALAGIGFMFIGYRKLIK